MDLKSARALLLTCKNNPVQGILLESFREEAREFARSVTVFAKAYNPSASQQIDAGRHAVAVDAEDVCLSLP